MSEPRGRRPRTTMTPADVRGHLEEETTAERIEEGLDDVARAVRDDTRVDEILALRAEVTEMHQLLATVAGLDMVSRSLENGFDTIRAQLEPLRQLVPPSVAKGLGDRAALKLVALRASLERPNWDNVGRLAIDTGKVPYIGEVPPEHEDTEGRTR